MTKQPAGADHWWETFPCPLTGRQKKPRTTGLTMVLDKGLGLRETNDLLEVASEHIDLYKLTFGTSLLYPERVLQEKIERITSFGIEVFPGGTLMEVLFQQQQLDAGAIGMIRDIGFTAWEVSDGTIQLPEQQRYDLIRSIRAFGLKVFTEVGKKEKGATFDPVEMARLANRDLEEGAEAVIVEARESGRGITLYSETGAPDAEMVDAFLGGVRTPERIIWEAPLKKQQLFYMSRLGNNVNLGNIGAGDVLAVESLRRGVRGDTFGWTLGECQPEDAEAT